MQNTKKGKTSREISSCYPRSTATLESIGILEPPKRERPYLGGAYGVNSR